MLDLKVSYLREIVYIFLNRFFFAISPRQVQSQPQFEAEKDAPEQDAN